MLKIDVEYKRGILFIRLKGILAEDNIDKLNILLERAINGAGIKYLMINCEKLYSIDNTAVEMIKERCENLLNNHGKLLICGYNDYVKLKIENSELNEMIYKINNEKSAFQLINI